MPSLRRNLLQLAPHLSVNNRGNADIIPLWRPRNMRRLKKDPLVKDLPNSSPRDDMQIVVENCLILSLFLWMWPRDIQISIHNPYRSQTDAPGQPQQKKISTLGRDRLSKYVSFLIRKKWFSMFHLIRWVKLIQPSNSPCPAIHIQKLNNT